MIPDDLRSLTVRQPHASAIVSGLKTVENRSWSFPLEMPATIAIHAGMKDDPFWVQHWPEMYQKMGDPADMPHGVILGVVDVVACSEYADHMNAWAIPHHMHWHLVNARPLRSPITTRGRQGLLPLPADVIEQIRFQLEG